MKIAYRFLLKRKTMSRWRLYSLPVSLAVCLLVLGLSAHVLAVTSINFTLPSGSPSYWTSAGVYNTSSGALIRTLWRHVQYTSGSHAATWDGKDDFGNAVSAGNYTIKVLYHNETPSWDGVIGNTSAAFNGGNVHKSMLPVQSLSNTENEVYYVCGYNEGQSNVHFFSNNNIQCANNVGHIDPFVALTHVATDGILTYVTNASGCLNQYTFVTAFKTQDQTGYAFPAPHGREVWLNGTYEAQHWLGVIDVAENDTATNSASAIAVQKNGQGDGTILAVAHSALNVVRLYHKTSGALVKTISTPFPHGLAFAANGDLWVLTSNKVERYAGASLTGTPTVTATITGFAYPEAIAAQPSGADMLMVADGGAGQQVKAYAHATNGAITTPTWTYGQVGGYTTNGPAVTHDKFGFQWPNQYNQWSAQTAITVLADGSFWIADSETFRVLHISATRTYLENVEYVPTSYMATADPNAPTRVFGGNFLEFKVNYAVPLQPGDPQAAGGNGCWQLVNNWNAGLEQTAQRFDAGLRTVVTLSNGHTYGVVHDAVVGNDAIVELTAKGLRYTGVNLDSIMANLQSDGSIRSQSLDGGNPPPAGMVINWYSRALTGFDQSNNPIYEAAPGTLLATLPANDGHNPYFHSSGITGFQPINVMITPSNVMVTFDPSIKNNNTALPNYHLGGMQLSTPPGGSVSTQLHWQASPSVTTDVPFDGMGSYDVGDGIQYAGGTAENFGHQIMFSFPGEFYGPTAEACQNMQFYDDGLFVVQYGWHGGMGNGIPAAGLAGNAYAMKVVAGTDGKPYQYGNDESNHAGIHRWSFPGITTVAEIAGNGSLDGTITVRGGTAPSAPKILHETAGNAQVVLTWTAIPGATGYNVYRGTTAGGESKTPIVTGLNGITCVNAGLTNGTTYYYTVKAVNVSGMSRASNEVRATPRLPVPVAPTGLTVSQRNTQVVLSWTASTWARTYNVYRGTSAGDESNTAIANGITGTTYTDSGLTNNTNYYYTVKGVNTSGTGNVSSEICATPSSIENPSFETPAFAPGWFKYNPSDASWTFTGSSGIASNAGPFTSDGPNAPDALQVAFLQGTASFSQSVAFAKAGSYTIRFLGAPRPGGLGKQDFTVSVDGAVVGTFKVTAAAYTLFKTDVFTVTCGRHTITFTGLNTAGGDNAALIDAVTIGMVHQKSTGR